MEQHKLITEETFNQSLDNIAVPRELLQQTIYNGIKQARKETHRRRLRISWQIASAICLIIVVFISSIRLSPAFASTISQIPWLAQIVDSVQPDKGLQDIIDQEYYEALNLTETKGDLTFTLDGTIADESGMILLYSVEAPYDISHLKLQSAQIWINGKELEAGISYGWSWSEERNVISEKIYIDTDTSIAYMNAQFELEAQFDDKDATSFTIPFTLTKPIAKTKAYHVNEEIESEGQKLVIEELRISPLRAQVDIIVPDSNTMQILDVNELQFIDENGEEWGKGSNGITARGNFRDYGKVTYYLESNYFRQPEALTLRIGEIEALPKGKDYIEVDFDKSQILYQSDEVNIDFNIINNSIEYFVPNNSQNQILSWGIDAEGKDIYLKSGTTHGTEDEGRHERNEYDISNAVNPVRFYISGYDSYLDGSAEIEIPLQK